MDSIVIYSNAAATTKQSGTFSNKSTSKARITPPRLTPNYLPKRRGVYVERQMSLTKDGVLGFTNYLENRNNLVQVQRKRIVTQNVTNINPLASTSIETNRTNVCKQKIKQRDQKSDSKLYKKSKYKSLGKLDKESVVLQFKRDDNMLVETASSYSEYSRGTTDTPVALKQSRKKEGSKDCNNAKNLKDAIDDPVTLVSKNSDNDKLYHFFLDLLENTLTDVESDKETARSKVHFDDKVGVVRDVKIIEPTQMKTAFIKPKYFSNEEHYQALVNEISPKKHKQNKTIIIKAKHKSTTNSTPKKKTTSKSRRHELLNSIKKQLRMDISTYEEPETVYESLKILARNKKLHKNSRHNVYSGDAEKTVECEFKRRRF